MDEVTPESLANEQSKPGKFSLIERLRGRNMPKDTITIYLDEGSAYERLRILEDLADEKNAAAVKALEDRLADAEARIRESAAVVHMVGIPSERYDALLDESRESFPPEYDEWTNPFTGQKQKAEKESEDRDNLFNSLFISESIEKVTIGNDEDTEIDAGWYEQFKRVVPLDGLRRVIETAYKMRMAVQWMDDIQNEDFSPRP